MDINKIREKLSSQPTLITECEFVDKAAEAAEEMVIGIARECTEGAVIAAEITALFTSVLGKKLFHES